MPMFYFHVKRPMFRKHMVDDTFRLHERLLKKIENIHERGTLTS